MWRSSLWFAKHANYSSSGFFHPVSQRRPSRDGFIASLCVYPPACAMLTLLLLIAAMQVAQATLPFGFGQPAMVIDPRTGRSTAPFKQILRVRLLLGRVKSSQVCLQYSVRRIRALNASVHGASVAHCSPCLCVCFPLALCVQLNSGIVTVSHSTRCLPEYLITFQ